MAWLYGTFTIPVQPKDNGSAAIVINALLDGIAGLAGAGWTKTAGATTYNLNNAWGAITHSPTNAQLAVAHRAQGNTSSFMSANQIYTGVAVGGSGYWGPYFAYSWPAGSAATLPTNPATVDARDGSALYSNISSNGTFTTTTESRWHVWAEDTSGALIIAVQQNTGSPSINGVGLFGDFVSNPINTSDTGPLQRQIQWAGANITLADGSTGEGQCLDGAGARQLSFSPMGSVGLTGTGGTALYQAPLTYASATAIVADGSVIKGRIDPTIARIGRHVSVGTTSDGQTMVYLRGKLWVLWKPEWGTFIV